MFSVYQKSCAVIFFVILASAIACAESNFDFFFKTAGQYQDVVVQEVLSANRIRLEGKTGEKGEVIRLIGLRAPEPPPRETIERDEDGRAIKQPVDPMASLEEQAFAFVQNLLLGQHVRVEFDSLKESEDHETLGYVFLTEENTFVNAEIIRQGFAHLSIQPPNMKYAEKLRAAYKEARAEQRGLQGE